MNPQQLLALPVRLFWCLSRNIDRIRADNNLHTFDLNLVAAGAAQGGGKEFVDGYRASLLEQRGTIMMIEEKVSSSQDIRKLMEM